MCTTPGALRALSTANAPTRCELLKIVVATSLLNGLEIFDFTVFGFFAAEPFLPPSLGLTLEQKADQLADTVRRAFEPTDVPGSAAVKRAAVKSIPILGRIALDHRTATYGSDLND